MSRTKIEKLIFDKLKTSQKVTPTTLDSTNNMYIEYTHDNVSIIVTNSDTSNSLTITIKGAPGFSDYKSRKQCVWIDCTRNGNLLVRITRIQVQSTLRLRNRFLQ